MNCPVCNARELQEDALNCPQCNSDLEIFRLIVKANEQRQKKRKIISALSLFAAVTAIGWASAGIFAGKASAPVAADPIELCPDVPMAGECRPVPSDSEMVKLLRTEIDVLKAENASLEGKTKVVKRKANGELLAVKKRKSKKNK
ncbi:MAG TPA: hypothetical protein VII99_07925 [Bacteroidia bacterium]